MLQVFGGLPVRSFHTLHVFITHNSHSHFHRAREWRCIAMTDLPLPAFHTRMCGKGAQVSTAYPKHFCCVYDVCIDFNGMICRSAAS
jgi:hypothetical protein